MYRFAGWIALYLVIFAGVYSIDVDAKLCHDELSFREWAAKRAR